MQSWLSKTSAVLLGCIGEGQHNRLVASPTCLRPGIQFGSGGADTPTKNSRQNHTGLNI